MGKNLVNVKLDAVGKAAENFMGAKKAKEQVTKKFVETEKALILELHKAKRSSIGLQGRTLKVQIISAREKIAIK